MYVLDANTLIEAKNRYYGFKLCPGFWDWLALEHTCGNVMSIEPIRLELLDPDIKAWGDANRGFFAAEGSGHLARFAEVSTWVNGHSNYTRAACASFLASADPRLVAYALQDGHTVVTHEKARPESRSRVLLPDVCDAFAVPYCDTFQVLNELKARFVLEQVRGN